MAAGDTYTATAGSNGCTFVEGHEAFSPDTRDRFIGRSTIVQASPADTGTFSVEFRQRAVVADPA